MATTSAHNRFYTDVRSEFRAGFRALMFDYPDDLALLLAHWWPALTDAERPIVWSYVEDYGCYLAEETWIDWFRSVGFIGDCGPVAAERAVVRLPRCDR